MGAARYGLISIPCRCPATPLDLPALLEAFAAFLRAQQAGAVPSPAAPAAPAVQSLTVAGWLPEYDKLITARGYCGQTLKNRRSQAKHIRRLWGGRPLAGLRAQEVAAKLRTLSTSSAGRVLAELRDIYSEAIAADLCENSPVAHLKAPRHKVLRERLVLEVWQQMRTLAKASNQRWLESLLLLALATGQRRGDLAKVRFSDVVDGHLRIEQQKEAGKGYGAKVEIPLTLKLDAIGLTLGEIIEHCRGSARPGPTLLRKAGGGPIEVSSLSQRFCECISAVLGDKDPGRYKRPSLHETRSLSARSYVEQGMDPKVVQVLLGHSDIEMTELYLNDRGLSAKRWKRVAVDIPT